jgi:hypothetical protein
MKVPNYNWVESDTMIEQSIKHKDEWVDAFFIFALVWSFGSILNESAKKKFDLWIRDEIKKNEEDKIIKAKFEEQ